MTTINQIGVPPVTHTPEYLIDRYESRAWKLARDESGALVLAPLRFHWIRHRNGETILHSGQGHSRRIDRETTIGHFFEKGIAGQSVGFAEVVEV